jgi:SAM-dependent methyltransferase
MDLRRLHNQLKFDFLKKYVKRGMSVFDVGCGRGGDIHKWNKLGCTVTCVDPDIESVHEANRRLDESRYHNISIYMGDISYGIDIYDVICYNFSLQYIFLTKQLFNLSINHIKRKVKSGGYFVGVVPDAANILKLPLEWTDSLGNKIIRGAGTGKNIYGDMILVQLMDGPYYSKGAIPEPMCHKHRLFEALEDEFDLISWEPLVRKQTGTISDIYSTFVFMKK